MGSVCLLLVAHSTWPRGGGTSGPHSGVAPVTLFISLWPAGSPEKSPRLMSLRFHKIQGFMGGIRCQEESQASQEEIEFFSFLIFKTFNSF